MSYNHQLILETKEYKNFQKLVEANFPRLTATYIKAFFKNIIEAYKEGLEKDELKNQSTQNLNNYFNQIAKLSEEYKSLKNIYKDEELKNKQQEKLNQIDELHKNFAINFAGIPEQEVDEIIVNAKSQAVQPFSNIISDEDIDKIQGNSLIAQKAAKSIASIQENNTMNNKLILSEQRLKEIVNEETYNVLAEAGFLDRFPGINNALQKLKSGEIDRASLSDVNINNLFNEFLKINNLLNTLNISTENLYKILNTINDPAIKTAARDLNTLYDLFSDAMKEFNYLIADKYRDNNIAKQFLAKSETEKQAFKQKIQQDSAVARPKYLNKAFNEANKILTMQQASGQIPKQTPEGQKLTVKLQDVINVINYLMSTNQYKLVEEATPKNTEFSKLVGEIVKGAKVRQEIATVILNALINIKAFGVKKIDTGSATITPTLEPLPKQLPNLQDIKEHLKKRNNYELLRSQLLN